MLNFQSCLLMNDCKTSCLLAGCLVGGLGAGRSQVIDIHSAQRVVSLSPGELRDDLSEKLLAVLATGGQALET